MLLEFSGDLGSVRQGNLLHIEALIRVINCNLESRKESILTQAAEMIRAGQYRFFSPAIDWEARDQETGEPQGATLTSGALTNHPFLEELPPDSLRKDDDMASRAGL